MKAREYAISLGLAKPGRGKLSKQAHAAIQLAIETGQIFEDYSNGKVNGINTKLRNSTSTTASVLSGNNSDSNDGVVSRQNESTLPAQKVTHDYNQVYGIDTNGRSAIVIAFGFCAKCLRQITYCLHDIPQLPDWIGGGDSFINWPTEEQKWKAMSVTQSVDTNSMKQLWEANS